MKKLIPFLLISSVASAQGVLENPSDIASGIGLVSGWHCTAQEITISIDGGPQVRAATGTSRQDTEGVCGHPDTGFGLTVNYGNLGEGDHQIEAFADGVRFANTGFTSFPYGRDFLAGAEGSYVLPGFPEPGQELVVEWSEANQNFLAADDRPADLPVEGAYYLHLATLSTPDGRVIDSRLIEERLVGTLKLGGGIFEMRVQLGNRPAVVSVGRYSDETEGLILIGDNGARGAALILSRGNALQLFVVEPNAFTEIDEWVRIQNPEPRARSFERALEVDCGGAALGCVETF